MPLWVGKAAAAIALIAALSFGGYYMTSNSSSSQKPKIAMNDFSDEDMTEEELRLAYEEVKKVLFKVSDNMNEGMDHTRVLGEFHKAKIELETTN